jgi:hypothetical protein
MSPRKPKYTELTAQVSRQRRCIHMAMGCISPLSANNDERLAWFRLLDAIEGREPRGGLEQELRAR